MRRVGKGAGITVAAAGCKPNILVIFAQNKEEMIAALRHFHPACFRDAFHREISVSRQKGPATA